MKEKLKALKQGNRIKVHGYNSTFIVSEVRLKAKYGTTGSVYCYAINDPNAWYSFPGYKIKLDKSK